MRRRHAEVGGPFSTPTKGDTGPIRARTFNFVDPGPQSGPAKTDNLEVVHKMIQNAITQNRMARGVSRVAAGGDLTVTYLVIAGNNVATAAIGDDFGDGEDSAALLDNAHGAYTGSKNRNHFEASTLVIDLVDAKTSKPLKRDCAARPLLRNVPDHARAARIPEDVAVILRDVRIAP